MGAILFKRVYLAAPIFQLDVSSGESFKVRDGNHMFRNTSVSDWFMPRLLVQSRKVLGRRRIKRQWAGFTRPFAINSYPIL